MTTLNRRQVTRLGIAAVAVALVAGAAGGGALTTGQSSITDNKWETVASGTAGPVVSVTGTPFDAELSKDSPTAWEDWTITNHSTTDSATVSGVLKDLEPSANADNVEISYGYSEGKSLPARYKWKDGGTLAHAKSFTLSDLLPTGKNTIDPGQSIHIRVRTEFKDPVTGVTANDKADFALTYQFS